MKTISYFTDGSVKNVEKKKNGTVAISGFIAMTEKCVIIDSRAYNAGKFTIGESESLAIDRAMAHIIEEGSNKIKYNLFTDSNECYENIFSVLYAFFKNQKPEKKYSRIIYSIAEKYIWLLNADFDFNIHCIKSHCKDIDTQKEFQEKIGNKDKFSNKELERINFGNHMVDTMVNYVASHKQIVEFQKDKYNYLSLMKQETITLMLNMFASLNYKINH